MSAPAVSDARAGSRAASGEVALLCAVPAERRALAGLVAPGVSLRSSGMGAEAAGRAAAALLATGPRAVVAAGFCGALDPALRVGDLVAAEAVADEGGARFPADPALLAAAPGRRGVLVSARRLARTPADRARLDGLAVDLESAAIARRCADAGVPFLALRAVTDEAGHVLPDFDRLTDAAGRLTPGAGLLHFLIHPGELRGLVRLGLGARRASRALADGVGRLLEALG
jgi:adenosylhomocysteine nucleosidase